MAAWTLAQLAAHTGAQLRGDAAQWIDGLGSLQQATNRQLAFLANHRYKHQLYETQAAAVLIRESDLDGYAGAALIVADPYAAFARLTHLFDQTPHREAGIHPTAVIATDALIDPTASIGAYVVIDSGVVIGAEVNIEAGACIHESVQIGAGSWIGCHVVIHHHCVIGQRVRIHAGAIIGADGFGFAPYQGHWHRIAQLGRVLIGDDCRIGANTTIDRGALDDTVIGRNVILDNQVQIAHNVQIGDHTAMAACSGVAGSTRIGRHCILAGGVGVVGHIEIADHVHLTGMTMVTKSITQAGSYSSGTAMTDTTQWKKIAVRHRQLADVPINQLQKQLSDMQARLEQLESRILEK
jgi:UDP-3-O-[3-hydroxymyristoyl] glucosamine N-acyltransferase